MLDKVRETLESLRPWVQRAWPQVKWPVVIVVSLYFMVTLLVWLPQRQLPDSGLSLKERLHQENENRKTLAQIMGGLFILVGVYLTWRRIRATEGQLRTMEGNLEVAREGQITERFTRAIEQLGRDKPLEVRLGAIYALERIARDSEKDHWPIMEVLTAYVREHALAPEGEEDREVETPRKPRVDIQAILTVIWRRQRTFGHGEEQRLDLHETDLRGADLRQAHLEGANLGGAYLEGAVLWGAHLEGAVLFGTDLSRAVGLTRDQIAFAIMDEKTKLPDYLENAIPDKIDPQ